MGRKFSFASSPIKDMSLSVHLVEEVIDSIDVETQSSARNTLSGFPVADRRRSWAGFRAFSQEGSSLAFLPSSSVHINLIVSVEDTGEGIPVEPQSRIFTPFIQVAHPLPENMEAQALD